MAHKYYLHSLGDTSTDDANTLHTSVVNDLTAGSGRSFGTATTIGTGNLSAGATVQWVHFTTESSGQAAALTNKGSWPGQTTWPTGTYNCIVNVTAAGANLTYGPTDLGSGVGHFARVNRAADAHVGSTTTGGSATGTGIKTFTASAWATTVPTGSWDDRLEVVIACTRAAGGHGNQSASMQVSSNVASDANGGVINTPHSTTTPALSGPTISRVGTTTHTYVENNNTITGSYPAGVAADDIVIVSVSNEDDTADWTTVPAGYTLRGRHTAGEEVMSTYYKILTGSDAALTFVANLGTPQDQSIIVTAYRGIDLTTPFDIADVIANGRVDVNFTPVTADSVMVVHMAKDIGFTRNNMVPTKVDDNPHLYPDGGTHATSASLQITQAFDRDIATAVAQVFSAHRENASDLKTRVMVLRPESDNRTGTISATQQNDVGAFTGNISIPAAATTDLTHYRFRDHTNANATLNSATFGVAENTPWTTAETGRRFRLRTVVAETTGGSVTQTYKLQYRINAGAWGDVAINSPGSADVLRTAISAVEIVPTSGFVEADATTDILSGAGSFIAGDGNETDITSASIALTANTHTEIEWSLWTHRWGDDRTELVPDGAVIDFRVVTGGGVPLDAYATTPSLTVAHRDGHLGGVYAESPDVVGPVTDGNGNMYALNEDWEGSALPMMMKSADDGVTWAPMDNVGAPVSTDLEGVSLTWSDDNHELHIAHHQTSGADSLVYHRFAVSTHATTPDEWVEIDTVVDNSAGMDATIEQFCSIVNLGSNDLRVFYSKDVTGQVVVYRDRVSGTWDTTDSFVWDTTNNIYGPYTARDATITYLFASEDDGVGGKILGKAVTDAGALQDLFAASVAASVLGTQIATGTGDGARSRINGSPPVIWDDGGVKVFVIYGDESNDSGLRGNLITVGSGGSVGTQRTIVATEISHNRGSSRQPSAALVRDTGTGDLYAFYSNGLLSTIDSDLTYKVSDDDGATWGTEQTLKTNVWANRVNWVRAIYNATDARINVLVESATSYEMDKEPVGDGLAAGLTGGFIFYESVVLAPPAITGTITGLQDSNAGTFTGTVVPPPITGTINATQDPDTAILTGTTGQTGTIAGVQDSNTGVFSGTFTPTPVTGTISGVQDPDTADISGIFTPVYVGTIAATQSPNIGEFTGSVVDPPFTGTIAGTQDPDVGVFTGTHAAPAFTGTIAVTQDDDTGNFAGTHTAPAFTGTISGVQADNVGAFVGAIGQTGTVTGVQDDDTGAFAGTVGQTGTIGSTQLDDTGNFAGTIVAPAFTGTIAGVQDPDVGSFAGTFTPEPRTGTIASTQDDNAALGWGIPVDRGSITSKTSGTTISRVPLQPIAVGNIAFAWCVADNVFSADGLTNNHLSVTDTDGHTWTKIREWTEGGGGIGSGVTVSLWATKVTSAIASPDVVTLTLSSARTAKVLGLLGVSIGSGDMFSVPSENRIGTNGTGTTPTASISGLPSIDRLWMGFFGWEGPSTDDYTQDPDYLQDPFKSISGNGTTGGVSTSNVTGSISAVRSNQTGDTYAPTLPVSRDWAVILAAIEADTRVFTAIFTPPPITGTISATQNDDAGSFTGDVVAPNFTGTISATQAGDTGEFDATFTALAFTGTIDATQDPDTLDATGITTPPVYAGTIAATQTDDTADLTGTVVPPAFTGTVDANQDNQTSNFVGETTPPAFTGTISATQENDTGLFTGTFAIPAVTGTIDADQTDDTANFTGNVVSVGFAGSIAGVQDPNLGEFTGTVINIYTGTVDASQDDDITDLTGTVTPPAFVGDIDADQDDQASNFTGDVVPPGVTGTISATQDADTGEFTGTFTLPAFTGTIDAAQTPDTSNFTGEVFTPGFAGSIAATQDDDAGSFTGTFTPAAITGSIASTQAPDTGSFTGEVVAPAFTGTIASTQAPDTGDFAGLVAPPATTGTFASTQDGDIGSFAGTFTPAPITGVISVTQDDNTIVTSGTFTPASVTGTITGIQDPNTGVFTAIHTSPAFSGVIASTQADDDIDITGVIVNSYTGIIVVTQDNDIASFSGQGAEAITGVLRKGRSFDARNRDHAPSDRDFD